MTLFGEEIVPEPEKVVGKTRAKKPPKEKKQETLPGQNDPDQNPLYDLPIQTEKKGEEENSSNIIDKESKEPIIPEAAIATEIPQTVSGPEEQTPGNESIKNERPEEKPVAKTAHDKPKQKKAIDKEPIAEKTLQTDHEEDNITINKKITQANLPDDWEGDKQYYSIGEVAALFNVKTSHIRFWTNEFKLKVRTNRKGDRLYTPAQIKELRAIHHLVKERGFTLSGAKAKMKTQNKMDVETIDLKQSLIQLRSKLLTIKNQLK